TVGAETDQSITITNTGTADLWVSGVTLDGAGPQASVGYDSARTLAWLDETVTTSAASQSFRVTSDTCSNHAVAPGASCAIVIAFNPATTGPATANLTIASNMPSGAATLALKGVGQVAQALAVPTATATAAPATSSGARHTSGGFTAFLGGSSGLFTPMLGGACTGVLLMILVILLFARRRRREEETTQQL
ncbi:MAG: hypothetical protein ACRDHE_08185, partial [Ktedonobacterales bacterium]